MEKNKNEIIVQIAALLSQLVEDNDNHQESPAYIFIGLANGTP